MHGLTYKRIGVYVYLGLTIIGLIFTTIKVLGVKSNWYLVRTVSWSFFVVLFVSPLVNWDKLVIESQVKVAETSNKVLDTDYLVSISSEAFPVVFAELERSEDEYLRDRLERRLGYYLHESSDDDWRAYSLRRAQLDKFIKENYSEKQQEELLHNTIYWWR